MKTTMTKKILSFILFLNGMMAPLLLNAQNCPANKVWVCRYDECGLQECKCVNVNQAQNWLATVPPCSGTWPPHCCHGGTWRTGENETGMEIKTSLDAHPNPVLNSATITFSLEQSQHVSLTVFDINGKMVSNLVGKVFEAGDNEVMWSTDNIKNGIYFLQFN